MILRPCVWVLLGMAAWFSTQQISSAQEKKLSGEFGTERAVRFEFGIREDDSVILPGLKRNPGAIGFVGLSYYTSIMKDVNVVALARKAGDAYLEPTREHILSGKYPLSRPLFVYVNIQSLERPEMREFVEFYLRRLDLAESAGYVVDPQASKRLRQQLADALKKTKLP